MIKIGSGHLSGRIIQQPKTTKTRPLTSKVRASIFNRLGEIQGLAVLDAYAGSGAFGIEALSLGAGEATFIEQARAVAKVIQDNLNLLSLQTSTVMIESVHTAAAKLADESFDIILADPPYDKLVDSDLELLTKKLANSGILIVSHSSRQPSPRLQNIDLLDARTYGDTTISYYRGKIG